MNDMQTNHNAILENRCRLMLTGVTDVESFDEEQISLFTQLGELTIKGQELHISQMSVDSGELDVEGDITALIYGDRDRHKRLSALGRLFK